MADDGTPRLWRVVGAVAVLGLVVLGVADPDRVFGIPVGQFIMLYMTMSFFSMALIVLFEDKRVRAVGFSIVAIGFLARAGEQTIGQQVSVIIALACLVVGLAVVSFGGAFADSRAMSGA